MSSEDRFSKSMAFTQRQENDGKPFCMMPRDPASTRAWGVSFSTWSAWHRIHSEAVMLETFKKLTPDDIVPLCRTLFWNACRCDDLPAGIDLMLFDAAFCFGPLHSICWLQAAVGVDIDGILGPVTMLATSQIDVAEIINDFATLRTNAFALPETTAVVDNDWIRRCRDCRAAALDMAGSRQLVAG